MGKKYYHKFNDQLYLIKNAILCDLHTVSVINSSCMEMVTILLFGAIKVRSLHIMMSMPVLVLTGKKTSHC